MEGETDAAASTARPAAGRANNSLCRIMPPGPLARKRRHAHRPQPANSPPRPSSALTPSPLEGYPPTMSNAPICTVTATTTTASTRLTGRGRKCTHR